MLPHKLRECEKNPVMKQTCIRNNPIFNDTDTCKLYRRACHNEPQLQPIIPTTSHNTPYSATSSRSMKFNPNCTRPRAQQVTHSQLFLHPRYWMRLCPPIITFIPPDKHAHFTLYGLLESLHPPPSPPLSQLASSRSGLFQIIAWLDLDYVRPDFYCGLPHSFSVFPSVTRGTVLLCITTTRWYAGGAGGGINGLL